MMEPITTNDLLSLPLGWVSTHPGSLPLAPRQLTRDSTFPFLQRGHPPNSTRVVNQTCVVNFINSWHTFFSVPFSTVIELWKYPDYRSQAGRRQWEFCIACKRLDVQKKKKITKTLLKLVWFLLPPSQTCFYRFIFEFARVGNAVIFGFRKVYEDFCYKIQTREKNGEFFTLLL